MAIKENKYPWFPKPATPPLEVYLQVHGRRYCLNRKFLAARSGKLAKLFKDNQNEELPCTFKDMPGDSAAFNLVMRFCYGLEPILTAQNVVPLICLAYYLEMTEDHSPGNLLNMLVNFFDLKVLPLWNESIMALHTTEQVFQQAVHLRLVDACFDSLLGKAQLNPMLLGEPFRNPTQDDGNNGDEEDNSDEYRPNARTRLFNPSDCQSAGGDLTVLTLRLYRVLMSKMIQHGVPSQYVAGSLYRYARKWANMGVRDEQGEINGKDNYRREVIETVEKLLPDETGFLSCKLLFQMLQSATTLQASSSCRHGFEIRIGKQLNRAKVEDLLIPSAKGYAMEVQYDTECIQRILKNFYSNYTSSDTSGLTAVAELIQEFLTKVASDVHLTKDKFMSLAAMSVATSVESQRFSDGIYRAIDVYLDTHRYFTESEKEEVCQVLDCYKMSPEACTHAAQNERLPLRVVVQALFVGQLQLRDAITSSKTEESDNGSREEEVLLGGDDSVEVKIEMEKMDTRMMELENEYCKMRKQIQKGVVSKEKGSSRWKALKRKFGCVSSMQDYKYSQVKKKVHSMDGVAPRVSF